MMGADYKIISYYSEKDRAYIVFAPDLPGCFADGETIKEAQDNIRQVIDEWKEFAQELGRKIPEPLTTLETTNATVLDVAKYILTQTGRISTLMLQKLLYYCNAWSLAWFHKPIFSQQFEAWAHGPVCRELFDYHKGKYAISTKDIDSQHQFSASEKKLINNVLSVYEDEDPEWLSELTHSETPWKETRGSLPNDAKSNKLIDPSLIESYYGSLVPPCGAI